MSGQSANTTTDPPCGALPFTNEQGPGGPLVDPSTHRKTFRPHLPTSRCGFFLAQGRKRGPRGLRPTSSDVKSEMCEQRRIFDNAQSHSLDGDRQQPGLMTNVSKNVPVSDGRAIVPVDRPPARPASAFFVIKLIIGYLLSRDHHTGMATDVGPFFLQDLLRARITPSIGSALSSRTSPTSSTHSASKSDRVY